jgi:hypothetical protein
VGGYNMKSKLEFWLEIREARDKFYSARGHDKEVCEVHLLRLASDYKFIYGEKFDLNKMPDRR